MPHSAGRAEAAVGSALAARLPSAGPLCST